MTAPDLHLTLPIPPSVNHSHRNVTLNGRRMRVPTKAAKDWTAACIVIAADAMNRSGWTCPSETKCVVEYIVWWADRRRRDPSNLEKVLLDGLELAGVVDDDRWFLPRCMDFDVDKGNPRVEVKVRRACDDSP